MSAVNTFARHVVNEVVRHERTSGPVDQRHAHAERNTEIPNVVDVVVPDGDVRAPQRRPRAIVVDGDDNATPARAVDVVAAHERAGRTHPDGVTAHVVHRAAQQPHIARLLRHDDAVAVREAQPQPLDGDPARPAPDREHGLGRVD